LKRFSDVSGRGPTIRDHGPPLLFSEELSQTPH
jgi:hypothetical protein